MNTLIAWGSGLSSRMLAGFSCTTTCTPTYQGWEYFLLTIPFTAEAAVSPAPPPSGARLQEFFVTGALVSNPGWINELEFLWTPAQPIRCDRALKKVSTVGCVFENITPTLHLTSDRHGEVAWHVSQAQSSGLPGSTTPLHRIYDDDARKRNGDTACPRRYPRPSEHECDEYPFRSTREGAATGGHSDRGRTFAERQCHLTAYLPVNVTGLGYSSCMVEASDNQQQGLDIAKFYREQRVLDGDPFYVRAS